MPSDVVAGVAAVALPALARQSLPLIGDLTAAECPARETTVPISPSVSVKACGSTTNVAVFTVGLKVLINWSSAAMVPMRNMRPVAGSW